MIWNYEQFAAARPVPTRLGEPPFIVPLVFESKFRGHGAMEAWTINGQSYPDAQVAPLVRGQRYRLQFINKSDDDHPLHLHRIVRAAQSRCSAKRGAGEDAAE